MRSFFETWTSGGDARIRDAVTELHAYALVLDAERHRTENDLAELGRSGAQSHKLRELRRRRADIAAQPDLLETTIRALRTAADPAERYL